MIVFRRRSLVDSRRVTSSTITHRTAMPDDPPRSPSGPQPDSRPTAGAPAWWGALGRPDLPLDVEGPRLPAPVVPAGHGSQAVRDRRPSSHRWRAWSLNAIVLAVAVLIICIGVGVVSFKMFLTVGLLFGVPLILAAITVTVVARRFR